MTQLEVVDKLPAGLIGERELLLASKYAAGLSSILFTYGDKLYGGIGRSSLTSPNEVWVVVLSSFRPLDVRGLRPWIREAARRFGYVRARTDVGNKVAARFAFANGFMYEETCGVSHYFSVRD